MKIVKKSLLIISGLLTGMLLLFTPALVSDSVNATGNYNLSSGIDAAKGEGSSDAANIEDIVSKIINYLLYAVGIASVVMLIFGGFKYITSGGDSGKVGEAKNTILYAIIGLVVAILAWAIVSFITKQFSAGA